MSDYVDLERETAALTPGELAVWLDRHLGRTVTAFALGVDDTDTVGRYAARTVLPPADVLLRLRHAYQAARLLVGSYGDVTARSWFMGTDGVLGDRAPALVLREATSSADLTNVVPAAGEFITDGFT